VLDEECAALHAGASLEWFDSGRLGQGVRIRAGEVDMLQMLGTAPLVSIDGFDRDAQEDAREITFAAGGNLDFFGPGDAEAYRIVYEVPQQPTGRVMVHSGGGTYDATRELAVASGKGWREMVLTRACLPQLGSNIRIESEAALVLRIDSITREELDGAASCSF
jgi:beta-glucosidase